MVFLPSAGILLKLELLQHVFYSVFNYREISRNLLHTAEIFSLVSFYFVQIQLFLNCISLLDV